MKRQDGLVFLRGIETWRHLSWAYGHFVRTPEEEESSRVDPKKRVGCNWPERHV
ncbi:unnamed protein product [Protopolystoma xenopodis]|uniref:Uncharacterized protein n=1 Tax=Protopolystoma xenopodis TaxID=117903 RepID=A0A3S5B7C9_9PLAT|nr:unnamed protein product [Protopolystoma xenopodis]